MKYIQKQLSAKKGKIVWLASYPKSGNTWFRCFISALFLGKIELDKLKSDGIFSSRPRFDAIHDVDSRLLTENEVLDTISEIHRHKAAIANELLFVKIHDALIKNTKGNLIVPSDVSYKAIYFVRNPLDIVASFAHHNGTTIDATIKLMNNDQAYLGNFKPGMNNITQFRQLMLSWSGHVKSWTQQKEIDVIVVRYEDMLAKPLETFSKILNSIDINCSKGAIKKAIRMASFENLKKAEQKHGFLEKNIKSSNFFRSGQSNQFVKELTKEQIQQILKKHKVMMLKNSYI